MINKLMDITCRFIALSVIISAIIITIAFRHGISCDLYNVIYIMAATSDHPESVNTIEISDDGSYGTVNFTENGYTYYLKYYDAVGGEPETTVYDANNNLIISGTYSYCTKYMENQPSVENSSANTNVSDTSTDNTESQSDEITNESQEEIESQENSNGEASLQENTSDKLNEDGTKTESEENTDYPENEIESAWVEIERTNPTCTDKGYVLYSNSITNEEKTKVLEALGHDDGEWTTIKEAGLFTKGSEQLVCTRDNYVLEEKIIDAKISTVQLIVGLVIILAAAFSGVMFIRKKNATA